MTAEVQKSDEEWRSQLTGEQYRVARAGGTEPAFTGAYWNTKKDGVYRCVCCDQPLFDSRAKYDSRSGWPSFFEPVSAGNLIDLTDHDHGMVRTEVRCNRCEAHLGHVFDDGPPPTGRRFCINSASLRLEER